MIIQRQRPLHVYLLPKTVQSFFLFDMMFARMLRPSRRHVHEQISQNDDSSTNIIINSDDGRSGNDAPADSTVGVGFVSPSSDDERQSSGAASPFVVTGGGDRENDGLVILDGNENLQNSQYRQQPNQARQRSSNSPSSENYINTPSNSESVDEHRNNQSSSLPRGEHQENLEDENNDGAETVQQNNATAHPFLTSLAQTERDIRNRRQATCSILILFFLIRLWIEALIEKDVGFLFLSLISTVWSYRWFVNRREAEEEFDRQLMGGTSSSSSLSLERNNPSLIPREDSDVEERDRGRSSSGADAAINFDPDLGLMSFQAQMALAILESQRQMFENGGYNAGNNHQEGPGVTDEAKEKWQKYEWGLDDDDDDNDVDTMKCSGSNYGSVSSAIGNLTRKDNSDCKVGGGKHSSVKMLSPSKLIKGGGD